MKLFKKMKDGGPESTVTGYWLIEIKSLFSIVLMKFDGNSREAFHTHAFNCWNWLIRGGLREEIINKNFFALAPIVQSYNPSIKLFFIGRDRYHKVSSTTPTPSWVLSFRGPWADKWKEYLPKEQRERVLTHGRIEL